MQTAAATDRGLVRAVNEDAVVADAGLGLLVVADGMGGHRAGDVASRIAVSTIYARLRAAPLSADPGESLASALAEANRAIYQESLAREALRGMGTTVAAAVARGRAAWIAHAGDSRVYLYAAGSLTPLTEDHSMVAEMVRRGEISSEEARRPLRNVVTRCLGTGPQVEADLRAVTWGRGDILLVCSDGLTGMLEDRQIADILRAGRDDLDAVCGALIDAANAAGGRDNISVVLAQNEE
jgi:protein phosphatase